MKNLKSRGFYAEEKAVQYLKNKGFLILKRNYRTRFGEIDIIAKKLNKIYFIEVKLIKNEEYLPEAKINYIKKRSLKRSALIFMEESAFANKNDNNIEFWLITLMASPRDSKKQYISVISNLPL